jgi:CRISPR system Cascade subunit CasE
MDALYQLPAAERVKASRESLAQEAGRRWLTEREDRWGISFTGVAVDRYSIQSFRKNRRARAVQLGILDISGHLTVQDPTTFQKAIAAGLGRAKGFGCGMMMIRRR